MQQDKYKSVWELNLYFKGSHWALQCKEYLKFFNTKGAYKLHFISSRKWTVWVCHLTFPFRSQLDQHETSCVDGKPDKYPKNDVSALSLMNMTWRKCDYSNSDERYLKQDMNTHYGEKRHHCKHCAKGFIYSMQLKRHYGQGECRQWTIGCNGILPLFTWAAFIQNLRMQWSFS